MPNPFAAPAPAGAPAEERGDQGLLHDQLQPLEQPEQLREQPASAPTSESDQHRPLDDDEPRQPRPQQREEQHKLKTVRFADRAVRVVLQNLNGPCPLLAAANALLLRGDLSLPSSGSNSISQDRLVQLVAGVLLDNNDESALRARGLDDAAVANALANAGDAVDRLPKLATGVDVNVKFSGYRDFEFTDEVAIFDALRLPLVHGWVAGGEGDGSDPASEVLGKGMSYNEAVEVAIGALDESSGGISRSRSGGGAAATTAAAAPAHLLDALPSDDLASAVEVDVSALSIRESERKKGGEGGEPSSEAAAKAVVAELVAGVVSRAISTADASTPSAPVPAPPASSRSRARVVRDFLDRTAGQLTAQGLVALHEGLRPGELAVFFRNNHFSTLLRGADGGLFTLVTDVGYERVGDVVWERLDSIDGDTQLLDSDFKKPARRAEDGDDAAAAAAAAGSSHAPPCTDGDLALAMQLQEEEEARARLARERAAERARARADEANASDNRAQGARVGGGSQSFGNPVHQHSSRPGRHGRPPRVGGGRPESDKCVLQ